MKRPKTKKRRISQFRIGITIGITSLVVVVLSFSLAQMLPKSHPIRALRELSGQSASTSKRVEVQGAPLAVAGTTSGGDKPEDEASLKPEISVDMQPARTPVTQKPKVGGEKSSKRTGAYELLTFDTLASYRIREPNWARLDDPEYIATLNIDDEIPPQIRALNGSKIEIEGFMLPLEGEFDNVRTFVLLKDQMACCFGAIPLLNEWVYVEVPQRKKIRSYQDVLVTLLGTLRVGAKFEGDILTGIYHLELDRLETDVPTLGKF